MVVGTRAASRYKDKVPDCIDRNHRPGIACSRWSETRGYRLPFPAEASCSRVKSSHHTARAIDAVIVSDRRSNDHEIIDDRRGGGLLVFARPSDMVDTLLQIDLAAFTEVFTRFARGCIQANQASIDRREEYSPPVSSPRPQTTVEPTRHSPVHQPFG